MAKYSFSFGGILAGLITACALAGPARAESLNPFQLDSGWMSYQRYKEKASNPEPEPAEKPPEIEVPEVAVAPEPPKSLDPPVMPGMNKGFNVEVNSTQDDPLNQPPKITHMDSKPAMQLPSKDWLGASEAARRLQNQSAEDEATAPLDIRMSHLPSLQAAVPVRDNKKKKMTEIIKPQLPKAEDDAAAAHAALEAYKRRELEAIQRDRETLTALQDAISRLGLQKELDFLMNSDSKLNTPADGAILGNAADAAPGLFQKPATP